MASLALGLLIEPAATNLIVQSQDMTQSSWTKANCATAANILAAPDNSTTAIPITVTASPFPSLRETFSVTAGTTYSFSAFAKWISGDQLIDFEMNDIAAGQATTYINIVTGATALINQTNWTLVSSSVTQILNNWFIIQNSFTPTFTSTNTWFSLYQSTIALPAGTVTGAATTVGSQMVIWGAQLTAGAATSYFPTTTAAATRSADVVTITLPNATYDILIEDTVGARFSSGTVVSTGSFTLTPRSGQLHVTRVRVWPSSGAGSLTAAQKAAIAPG